MYICAYIPKHSTQWQQRSSRTTTKDLWKRSQAFSWGWKRLYFAPTCILSVASAFGFHTNINIYTPRYTSTPKHTGPKIITVSQIHIKNSISLRGECEVNEALTHADLKPHKETDCSLQSLPSMLHCYQPQRMSRDTPCSQFLLLSEYRHFNSAYGIWVNQILPLS